jgi:hypothetical protein
MLSQSCMTLGSLLRTGWAGPRASASMCLAWFVWQRGYAGKTEIDRIWWRHRNE